MSSGLFIDTGLTKLKCMSLPPHFEQKMSKPGKGKQTYFFYFFFPKSNSIYTFILGYVMCWATYYFTKDI